MPMSNKPPFNTIKDYIYLDFCLYVTVHYLLGQFVLFLVQYNTNTFFSSGGTKIKTLNRYPCCVPHIHVQTLHLNFPLYM